ncbi:MAG: DUF1667 domain-containing protein [Oscillibacter sp.]|jgi:CxxC motif-containing protein|nr:DUF1667 domain-containing protein [Oscillibacter sp.]
MRQQEIICTVCPMGCHIRVTGSDDQIQSLEGYTCRRGEQYARSEFVCPMRTLTTTVRVENSTEPLLAVRTAGPIPKEKLFDCMGLIRTAVFHAPVALHQILISNLGGTGVDLISCAERKER